MRKAIWTMALLLAVIGPTYGQTSTFLRPVNPRDITFTPIDTKSAIVSPSLPAQPSRFSLRGFFSKFSLPSFFNGPHFGSSPYPPPSSFPSTHYKSPIQPVMPIPGK